MTNKLDFTYIKELLHSKKFDDIYKQLIERARYLSETYSNESEILRLSDGFALCARDILLYQEELVKEINYKKLEENQESEYSNNLTNIKEIWYSFNTYNKISKSNMAVKILVERYNPKYMNSHDCIIPLINSLEEDFLKEIHSYSDIEKLILDIQVCIDFILHNQDWLSDKSKTYANINNQEYEKFSWLYSPYDVISEGKYYEYIEIVKNLNKYQDDEKLFKIISHLQKYNFIYYHKKNKKINLFELAIRELIEKDQQLLPRY